MVCIALRIKNLWLTWRREILPSRSARFQIWRSESESSLRKRSLHGAESEHLQQARALKIAWTRSALCWFQACGPDNPWILSRSLECTRASLRRSWEHYCHKGCSLQSIPVRAFSAVQINSFSIMFCRSIVQVCQAIITSLVMSQRAYHSVPRAWSNLACDGAPLRFWIQPLAWNLNNASFLCRWSCILRRYASLFSSYSLFLFTFSSKLFIS